MDREKEKKKGVRMEACISKREKDMREGRKL